MQKFVTYAKQIHKEDKIYYVKRIGDEEKIVTYVELVVFYTKLVARFVI
jgi:hypothetical protein